MDSASSLNHHHPMANQPLAHLCPLALSCVTLKLFPDLRCYFIPLPSVLLALEVLEILFKKQNFKLLHYFFLFHF